jgi:acyl carrier protein
VREYVTENFLYMRQGYEFSDTDSLPGHGIIDFAGVLELVAFVRREFDVRVDEGDITEENFGTLAAIASFIAEKQLAHLAA